MTQRVILRRETETEHGMTLICDRTLSYRVREFEEHGITSGSICTFTYRVPESGAVRRFRTDQKKIARLVCDFAPEGGQAARSGNDIDQLEKGMPMNVHRKNGPFTNQDFKWFIKIFDPHGRNIL